jgi:hypothetical protein
MAPDRFCGGAPMRLEGWMGLIKPDDMRVRIRALLMILVGWVPLVLLAGLQDSLYGGNSLQALLSDFGSLARCVIAAPLFVMAESLCFPRFERIILHFRNSGLIAGSDHDRYENIVHSSSKLLRSKNAEIVSFVIAYGLAAAAFKELPPNRLISWSYYLPLHLRTVRELLISTVLPFVPVLFIVVTVKEVFDTILKLATS